MNPDNCTEAQLWEALANLVNKARETSDEHTRLTTLGCTDAAKPHATRYAGLHELIDALLNELGTRATVTT